MHCVIWLWLHVGNPTYNSTHCTSGSPIPGCLQIQANKFVRDFQISRRFPGHILRILKLPRSHCSCLPDGLYLILADSYWATTLISSVSDPVYQVNVMTMTVIMTIIHNHRYHLPFNWTGIKFLRLDAIFFAPSVPGGPRLLVFRHLHHITWRQELSSS